MASYIQETEGAIGYVEYSYALEANFSNAALLNKSGSYVTPSVSSIAAAGATATALSSTNFNIIYSAGGSAYPLANFSWALIYQKQADDQHRHRPGQALPVGHHLGAELLVRLGLRAVAGDGGEPGPLDVAGLADGDRITDLHQLIGGLPGDRRVSG